MTTKSFVSVVLSIIVALAACDRGKQDKPVPPTGPAKPAAVPAKPDTTTPEGVASVAFAALQANDEKAFETFLVTAEDVTKLAEQVPQVKEGLKSGTAEQAAAQLSQMVPASFKRAREGAAKKIDFAKATFVGLAMDSSTRKEANGIEMGYVRFAVKGADGKTYRFEFQDMIRFPRGWAGGGIGFVGEENRYLWGKVRTQLDSIRDRVQNYVHEKGDQKGWAELDKVDIGYGGTPAAWAVIGADILWSEKLKWPGSPACAACVTLVTAAQGYVITFDSSKANIPGAPPAGTLSIDHEGKYTYGGSATALQSE